MDKKEIPGLLKTFEFDYPYQFNNKQYSPGESILLDSEDCRFLLGRRTKVHLDPNAPGTPVVRYFPVGRMTGGGCFDLQTCPDEFHKVTPWGSQVSESEPWLKIEALVAIPGLLVQPGDKRRLRRSHALSFPHRYVDTQPLPPGCSCAPREFVIEICEPRPKRPMSDEEVAERQQAVADGRAREQGWMAATAR